MALRYILTTTQTDPLDLRVIDAKLPSMVFVPREEGFDLVSLEFFNSKIVKEDGVHHVDVW